MLVITRRFGEKVMIGDDIEITLLDTGRKTGEIKLGIDSPKDLRILREELYRMITEDESAIAEEAKKLSLEIGFDHDAFEDRTDV